MYALIRGSSLTCAEAKVRRVENRVNRTAVVTILGEERFKERLLSGWQVNG